VLDATQAPEPDETLEHDLVFAGVVGMIDPPRLAAPAAVAEAQAAGVRVVMITGDHARTAKRIAADLGIVSAGRSPSGSVLSGAELDAMDDASLRAAAPTTAVYARVSPEHKLRIVHALKANGDIVAMTGDGVNDAPALRAADIGVAMGSAGTDVSKEAANVILADDNFATIVTAIREGRAIFANIRRFLRYLLSSNAGEVLTVFLGVVAAPLLGLAVAGEITAPLLATQILWINLLTDSAPALALGFEAPHRDVMRRPPRGLTERVIDRPMWLGVLYIGMVMAGATLLTMDWRLPGGVLPGSGSVDEARTMGFTVLVLAQLFNAVCARSSTDSAFARPLGNPQLLAAIAVSLALQVLVVHLPILNDGFGTVPLGGADWLACIAVASSVLWAEELRKLVARRRMAHGR
jgi:magnesium-transporting ATPase (P-type)